MKKLLLAATSATILFCSCGKDYNNDNVGGGSFSRYTSLDSVFSMLSLKPKYVNLDASTGGSFYGNSGTKYTFPPSAFQNASGAVVTGTVQMAVTEYVKRGDMIFSEMLPVSDGIPLESAGQVNILATQGGAELAMAAGKTFTIDIPQGKTPVQGMQIFAGGPGNAAATGSRVNWRLRNTDTMSGGGSPRIAVVYKTDTLSMIMDSLNMINGDIYKKNNDTSNQVRLIVSAQGKSLRRDDFRGFVMLADENSVFRMPGNYGNSVDTIKFGLKKLPYHFVAIALIDGKYCGGVLSSTPETGNVYTINMVEVDPFAFKAQLNALYK